MNTKIQKDRIVIALEGRIDTTNAAQVEADISALLAEHPDLTPAFDAGNLSYISSAGLRVLMKISKASGKKLSVSNVSKEVYEIFETTGFTNILDVQKRIREISVEGCEVIGSGGFGTVYRTDPETIAKLYLPSMSLEMIQHERDVAQKAFLLGVPTAISYDVVKCGESYGVVFELLNAKTVAQVIDGEPDRLQEMGERSAKLLKELHGITLDDSTSLPDRKADFFANYEKIVTFLTPEEGDEILAFVKALPEGRNFLHGDFNSKNIMVNGDDFLLIDIGDATFGHPVFDLAGLILAYQYLPSSPMPEAERRRLLGFPLEAAPAMLNTMFSTYFGIEKGDREAMAKRVQNIMPYAQLLATYQGSRRVNFNPDYMEKILVPVVRTRLLPLIRNAAPLEW